MTLADRIVVLSAGHIEQVGAPMELYRRPNNLFVAKFIGSPAMNIIPATIAEAGATTRLTLEGGAQVTVPVATDPLEKGAKAHFGVRPEDLTVTTGEDFLFQGKVALIEALGEVTLIYIEGLTGDEPIIAKLQGDATVERGASVRLTAEPEALHLFSAEGRSYLAT
jgi:alpha-glucoside transport system ATP-binding protein